MVSFNSTILAGHLARDPELRYTPQGKAVADFTIAVNRKYTRQNGEKVEDVAFIDITVWDRMGETCAEYLKKGRAVLVAGHLVQDRWQDEQTGQKRSKLKVVAERVQFLGGGSKDGETPLAESASPEPLVVPEEPAAPAPVSPKGTNGNRVGKPRR
jgi:single-strand DNA-binding protein